MGTCLKHGSELFKQIWILSTNTGRGRAISSGARRTPSRQSNRKHGKVLRTAWAQVAQSETQGEKVKIAVNSSK